MASLERKLLKAELKQRSEEGCDTTALSNSIEQALNRRDNETELLSLYEELIRLPIDPAFPYEEPSVLHEIKACRPNAPRKFDIHWEEKQIYDKTLGGWLGRASGCALGKPVEGWPKSRIDRYLSDCDSLPLNNYLPFDERILPAVHKPSTLGNITYMDRDDDMDFPILGLLALEQKGAKTSSRSIANTWISRMPFGNVYTAEQVAYRNFVNNVWPPDSASFRNPFREWIGAQIRADIFGYVAPGCPEKAAELAFRDASISHTKNGIYGEMFVAAMIASAYILNDVEDIISAGLAEIPEHSRLSEAIQSTQDWCRDEEDWEKAWQNIYDSLGKYHGVHTINNAALVVMGLYFGRDDFEAGITKTVRGGWDADCTGATVGSILGVKFGAKALPSKWTAVFNDRLLSAVRGENDNKISELAARTLAVAKKIAEDPTSTLDLEGAKLHGTAGGIWSLETGWGKQRLDFATGKIEFTGDDHGPYKLVSTYYQHPELKFSFAIDKGGWDFEVDFEGTINDDRLTGNYFPGETPVDGQRVSNT